MTFKKSPKPKRSKQPHKSKQSNNKPSHQVRPSTRQPSTKYLWENEVEWKNAIRQDLAPSLGYSNKSLLALEQTHLIEALTHRTYAHEHSQNHQRVKDNQRLEFLGDAILGYVSTIKLFERLPNATEGELTALRAGLINRNTLRNIAVQAKLDPYLRIGKGEVNMGEAARDARLADLSEAIIAAIYLDLGLEKVTDWIWLYLGTLLDSSSQESQQQSQDPKTDLQHWSHQNFKLTPYYTTEMLEQKLESKSKKESINQAAHRYYKASVFIGEKCYGSGQGRTKREAQRRAAQEAIDKLDF